MSQDDKKRSFSFFNQSKKKPFLFDSDEDFLVPKMTDMEDSFLLNYIDPKKKNYYENSVSDMYTTPADFEKLSGLPQDISFIHINCRSPSNKLQDIIILNNHLKAKVIAVTETWLSDDSESLSIPGYSFILVYRSGKKSGGVGFFIYQDFHFSRVALPFDFKSFEGLFVKLELHHRSMLLGVIYRPPSNSTKLFNDEFQLDNITKRHNCVLLGDFNLDNIFSNIYDRDSITKIIIDNISDHLSHLLFSVRLFQ